MSFGATLLIAAAAAAAGSGTAETPPAIAPPATTATVLIAAEAGDGTPGGGAAAGSVDGRWTTPRGDVLTAGVASRSVGGGGWTVVRIGAAVRPGRWTVVDLEAGAGPGRQEVGGGTSRFTYLSLRAGLTRTLVPGRLWLRLGDHYLDVEPSRGHLPEAELTAQLRPGAALALRYGRSVGGDLGTEFAVARLDLAVSRGSVLAGVAAGRSTPVAFELPATPDLPSAGGGDLRQFFAGVRRQWSRGALSLIADHLELAAVTRDTLTVVVELPLARRGAAR